LHQTIVNQKTSSLEQKNAVQILDQAICHRNKDFNLYILDHVFPKLIQQVVEIDTPRDSNQEAIKTDLLNCIEKWSCINSSFAEIYKNLIDIGIQFPSQLKEKHNPKKSVSFCLLPLACEALDSLNDSPLKPKKERRS
jgi:hypothetical protein